MCIIKQLLVSVFALCGIIKVEISVESQSVDYSGYRNNRQSSNNVCFYYMEESVLLGTKPLVDSIRHFIRDPSGVFSVCHLCECRIVQ